MYTLHPEVAMTSISSFIGECIMSLMFLVVSGLRGFIASQWLWGLTVEQPVSKQHTEEFRVEGRDEKVVGREQIHKQLL